MKRILFVCKDNGERSRIAAAFTQRLAWAFSVPVLGTSCAAATPFPPRRELSLEENALAVMAEIGIPLQSPQRPVLFTPKLAAEADVVVTLSHQMDAKAQLITDWNLPDWRIEDWETPPFPGEPLLVCRMIREQIRHNVESLLVRLDMPVRVNP